MNVAMIPRCIPPPEFADLPYHWVQWRTPYRSHERPLPWLWHAGLWYTSQGLPPNTSPTSNITIWLPPILQ